MKMFQHEYQTCIVCPHCGHQHCDTCDYFADTDDVQCSQCNKEFTYERIVEVTFTTKAKEPAQ